MLLVKMRLWSMIRSHLAIFLSLVLVSTLAMALMVGISGAYYSLNSAVDAYLADYGYPDARLTTALGGDMAGRLAELDGVASVRARIQRDTQARAGERYLTARVFSYAPEESGGFYLREGALEGGIYLEYEFARNNHLNVGDQLTIGGGAERIAALVSSPECISVYQNRYIWGDNSDFGYVFAPAERVKEWFPEAMDNQFLLDMEEGADGDRVLAQAEELLERLVVTESYTFEDSPVHTSVTYNTKPLYAVSLILPPIFFAAMLLTVALFLMQIVRRQRRQLGLYATLGFSRGEITLLFCAFTLAVTLAAAAAGMALSKLLMELVCGLYADAFSMPRFRSGGDWKTALLAAGVTAAVGQAATLLGVGAACAQMPAEAMRPAGSDGGQPPLLVRTVLKGLPVRGKIAVSTALRRPGRLALSVVCLSLSIGLITIAFSFSASKDAIVAQLFQQRIQYDCQLFFPAGLDGQLAGRLSGLDGVSEVEQMLYTALELSVGEEKETAVFCGLPEGCTGIAVYGRDGERLETPDEGIILEAHLAEKYGLAVGDTVSVNGTDCRIAGLSGQYVNRINYGSLAYVARLAGTEGANSLLLKVEEEQENALLAQLDRWGEDCSCVFTRLLYSSTLREFRTYDIGVGVITLFALMMAFVIVYVMSAINLEERRAEFGTMLTLGYLPRDISLILLTETLCKLLLSLALALPAGAGAAMLVLRQMSTARREYPFANTWVLYAAVAAVILLFALAAHGACQRKIRRLDLAESTKYSD